MKDRVKTILLIFSLAINAAVLGVLGYSWATFYMGIGEEEAPPTEQSMLSQTGLPVEEVERSREDLRMTIAAKRTQLAAKREELIGLLMEPTPNTHAVAETMDEINGLQGTIQKAVMEQMLSETNRLTAKQRQLYFQSIGSRMRGSGMMAMGRYGRGHRRGRGRGYRMGPPPSPGSMMEKPPESPEGFFPPQGSSIRDDEKTRTRR